LGLFLYPGTATKKVYPTKTAWEETYVKSVLNSPAASFDPAYWLESRVRRNSLKVKA